MLSLRTWVLPSFAAMLLPLFSAFAFAQRNAGNLRTTNLSTVDASQRHEPAGSPELGVLIIIGVIGLLIFIAWVISRFGESGNRSADGTLN